MLEAVMLWIGALGIGILAWIAVKLFFPTRMDNITGGLATFLGMALWGGAVMLYTAFPKLHWLWVTLYIICWALNILAAFSIFVVFGGADERTS